MPDNPNTVHVAGDQTVYVNGKQVYPVIPPPPPPTLSERQGEWVWDRVGNHFGGQCRPWLRGWQPWMYTSEVIWLVKALCSNKELRDQFTEL